MRSIRADRRQANIQVLGAIALKGLSTLPDVHHDLAYKQHITMGASTLRRVTQDLHDCKMLRRESIFIYQGGRITLLSLTARSRDFIEGELQQPAVESDWEKMDRGHEGDRFPRHTASVLAFAYHARLRGWQGEVMPEIQNKGGAVPDLWVEKGDESYYVEVEIMGKGGSRKRNRKWTLIFDLQEYVAVCTPDRNRRRIAVAEIRERHFAGMATDLATLTAIDRAGSSGNLWLERWSW